MMNHKIDAAKYDDIHNIWNENKSTEIEFWRLLLSGRFPNFDWCEDVRMRLRDQRPLAEPLSGFAGQLTPALVEIIDVGSGPAPYLGTIHPSKIVRLLMVDPLADEYNNLLRENGYSAYANIVGMEGENLSRDLPNNHFHIAYSRNALDHSWNPVRCIEAMIDIIVPEGLIYIEGHTNEGVRENYVGLHQWNFRSKPDGDCSVWRPGLEISLRSHFGESIELTSLGNDEWFSVSITKRS